MIHYVKHFGVPHPVVLPTSHTSNHDWTFGHFKETMRDEESVEFHRKEIQRAMDLQRKYVDESVEGHWQKGYINEMLDETGTAGINVSFTGMIGN
jgi:hypothetical protein